MLSENSLLDHRLLALMLWAFSQRFGFFPTNDKQTVVSFDPPSFDPVFVDDVQCAD